MLAENMSVKWCCAIFKTEQMDLYRNEAKE